jgi:hypothetical protein
LRVDTSAANAVFETWNQFLSGHRGLLSDTGWFPTHVRQWSAHALTSDAEEPRHINASDCCQARISLEQMLEVPSCSPRRLCAEHGRVRPDCSCRRSPPTPAAAPKSSANHSSPPSESRTAAPLAMWPARAAQPWSTGGSRARVERTRFGEGRSRPHRWRQQGGGGRGKRPRAASFHGRWRFPGASSS